MPDGDDGYGNGKKFVDPNLAGHVQKTIESDNDDRGFGGKVYHHDPNQDGNDVWL
jgi:hypothetical protein